MMENVALETEVGIIAIALELYADHLNKMYKEWEISHLKDRIAFETKVRNMATFYRNLENVQGSTKDIQ